MQELGKFDLKINVTPNGLGKYMSFNINNKSIFIDRFQFLSSPLDSFVKNLDKDNFQSLSQDFDSKVLDLVKEKRFYPFYQFHEYMSGFKKFKEEVPIKEKFYIVC